MYTTEEKARIRWACRRGMLELDVVVMPFLKSVLRSSANKNNETSSLYWSAMIPICLLG